MRPWISCVLWLALGTSSYAATQNDVVIGNGGTGPYMLAWKGIPVATVSASENGTGLIRGLDYNIDAGNGQINFVHPLPDKASVLVQYEYDPAQAQRTNGQIVVPLTIPLKESSRHDVFLSARYQKPSDQTTNTPGSLTVGVGSLWHGSGQSQAGFRVFMAPSTLQNGSQTSHGPAATGLAIVTTTDAGHGSLFSLGYDRATNGVNADPDAGLQCGRQLFNLSAHMAPTSSLHADVGYKQTDVLDASAPSTTVSTAAVTMTPTKSVQLTAGESRTTQGTQAQQTTQLGLAVHKDNTLRFSTGVDLYHDQSSSRQVASVGGLISPLPIVSLEARYQSRMADPTDQDIRHSLDTTDMKLSLQSPLGVKLTGSYGENPTDGNGDPMQLSRRGVGLESALGAVKLSGGYDWSRQTGAADDATALRFGVDWRLSSSGELLGGYNQTVGGSNAGATPWLTTYTFGYRRNLGETFSLSLTGTLNRYPGVVNPGLPDYLTTANLGAKF